MVRLNRNSRTSSKLPSSDPNHKRGSRAQGERKAGEQESRDGVTLKKVDNPDKVEIIKVDRRKYPQGKYQVEGQRHGISWNDYGGMRVMC
ncbi:MAG: hypothetical protein L3J17_06570 [Candidatus Jettenia sp.]|nr:MAG: hypothetical protein L3J17_06570 [Candidatus Jettenia sp.]